MKNSGIEWIGQIPDSWDVCRIKNLPDYSVENCFIDGDWIESPDIADSGIRYLTTGNVGDGQFKYQGNGYITQETFGKLNCKFAYPGDWVIARLNAPYGRSCILPSDEERYVLAVDIVILRTKYNKKYFCYFTQCQEFQHTVEDYARGTAMKRISRTNLGAVKIVLPSIVEQGSIVDCLDVKCAKIDKLIEVQQAQIEKLKEYKQSVITEAVTKGLDPTAPMKDSGVEWIGKIPEDWELIKIGSLFACRNEKVSDSEFSPLSVSRGGIVPQMENVAKSDAGDNRKLVLKNDFVINSRSDRKQSCGVSSLDGSVSLINTVLYPIAANVIIPEYVNIVMKNYGFAEEFYRWGHGIVADLWTTRWQEMKIIVLPIPSIEIQKQIVKTLSKRIDTINTLIALKQSKIDKLQEYKKSLIYEYVTGKKEIV